MLNNTIVAGNEVGDNELHTQADCSAGYPLTFLGYSLFGSGTGCDSTTESDQAIDPTAIFTSVLISLADNGGPTPTHALVKDSPAINSANNNDCVAHDQRGISRPQYNGCDIGSFEKRIFYVYIPSMSR